MRLALLLLPMLLAWWSGIASAAAGGSLRAQLAIANGPYYVGQAIGVQVAVVAERVRPAIRAPMLDPAAGQLIPAGSALEPIATGAISDAVSETNRFRYLYRLVPRRPGVLALPPFAVRLGDGRQGSTPARRIEVRQPPTAGQPTAFLGGVGPLAVGAEASPRTVQVGEPFEYRLRLEGFGALGSTRRPGLERLQSLPIAPEVEGLPVETSDDPPARVFRYRVRPRKTGAVRLPPVPIAWFDPLSERYQTALAPAVPVRVADVAPLDPTALQYGPQIPHDRPRRTTTSPIRPCRWPQIPRDPRLWMLAWGAVFAVLLAGSMWTPTRPGDPRRFVRRAVRRLDPSFSNDRLAAEIDIILVGYLRRAIGRVPGSLTPDEAHDGILRAAGDRGLARRAAWVVAWCDRVRFAPPQSATTTEHQAREALAVLGELARRAIRDGGRQP